MNKKTENKRQKFIRLAELRTEKAVLAIENLIALSNQRNYDYNTNQYSTSGPLTTSLDGLTVYYCL